MATKTKSYKDLQAALDETVIKLQSSDIDVDEAMQAYDNGMKIIKELEAYLKTAENKITKIQADWDKEKKL